MKKYCDSSTRKENNSCFPYLHRRFLKIHCYFHILSLSFLGTINHDCHSLLSLKPLRVLEKQDYRSCLSKNTSHWIFCLSVRQGSFKAKFMRSFRKRNRQIWWTRWAQDWNLIYLIPEGSAKISLVCFHLLACLYLGTRRHPPEKVKSGCWSLRREWAEVLLRGTLHIINVTSDSHQLNENFFPLFLLPLLEIDLTDYSLVVGSLNIYV